ncbi:MAG: acyltransferase [Tepidisphaeraceae bacterium]
MTPDAQRPSSARHLPALDGVRGVALLAVLAFHFIAHGPGESAWPAWVRTIALGGWAGVDLFFVLSGFLITRILLAGRGTPGAMCVFYLRRALCIFPLYYALLAVLTIGLLIAGRGRLFGDEPFNLAALWLYVSNFNVAAHGFGSAIFRGVQFSHLWTLAIEEQFYLVWPLLILFTPRRWLLPVCVAVIVASPAVRALRLHAGANYEAVYVSTDCRIDSLAWGALVAVLAAMLTPNALRRFGLFLSSIGIAAMLAVITVSRSPSEYGYAMQTAGYTALAMAFAGWIACLAGHEQSRPSRLTRPWLMAVGRYSYGAYLFHVPLRGAASFVWRRFLQTDPTSLSLPQALLTAVLLTAATLVAAAVSFRLYESHWLRLKPKLANPESADS